MNERGSTKMFIRLVAEGLLSRFNNSASVVVSCCILVS